MGTKVNSNYEDLITFTRASKGHALRPVSYGDELSEGSDFSSWDNNSTFPFDTFTVGSSSLTVANSTGKTSVASHPDSISLVSGRLYVVDVEFSITSGTFDFSIREQATTTVIAEGADVGAGETQQRITFVSDVTATTVIQLTSRSGTANATIDNISVREVTFDESDGTLTLFEHPENVPRVEYDADGNRLGLLVEEARTTLVTSSEDFSGWSNINAPLEANSIEAPDGTVTATKLVANTENGQHRRDYPRTYSAGTYTFSVFAKVGGYNYLELRLAGDGVYVDIRDGSLAGASAGITTSYEDVGNGWKRIAITHSAGANDTARINVVETSGQRSFAGDGTSGIYIWGAQLEEGSFPTSYIKTTGSTATRSADVASIPVADFGYNQSAGTLVVDFAIDNTTSNKRLFSLNDGGTTERIDGLINSANSAVLFAVDNNSNVVNESVSGYVDGEFSKVAASYKLNDYALTMDGATPASDTSATVPAITTLTIGTGPAFSPTNGHIKSIKYYPRRLTNAQLQDLTS